MKQRREKRPTAGQLRMRRLQTTLGQGATLILYLGLVSLFADMTYEGARSSTGPFLASLGARPAVVGLVAGAGELLGYAVRLPAGLLADRTGRPWIIAVGGYLLNLAVPALALAGDWATAAALVFTERLGKGVRTPARDLILAQAAADASRGLAFGLHELLDQLGAIVGPVLVAAALALTGSYRVGFGLLVLPALAAATVLLLTAMAYPEAGQMPIVAARSQQGTGKVKGSRSRHLMGYMSFVAFSVAGLIHFQLLSFHFKVERVLPDGAIPLVFAGAMGADALIAPLAGRLFDLVGMRALWAAPVASAVVAPLAFWGRPGGAIASVLVWGAVVGWHETVLRAAVAHVAPAQHRGTVYGVFNTAYGLAWLAGSAVAGLAYGFGSLYVIILSISCQAASVPFLAALTWRGCQGRGGAGS